MGTTDNSRQTADCGQRKFQILNPKSQTNSKPETRAKLAPTWNLEPETWNARESALRPIFYFLRAERALRAALGALDKADS